MANGTEFKGANQKFGPPKGVSEEQCHTLHVFMNGNCIVACWEIGDDELQELIRTRRIFTSVWSGEKLYPMAVGAESGIRALVADYGAVWKLENEPQNTTKLDAVKLLVSQLSKADQYSLAWQIAEMLNVNIEPGGAK